MKPISPTVAGQGAATDRAGMAAVQGVQSTRPVGSWAPVVRTLTHTWLDTHRDDNMTPPDHETASLASPAYLVFGVPAEGDQEERLLSTFEQADQAEAF